MKAGDRYDAETHTYTRSSVGRLPGATDIIRAEGLINLEYMTEEARWRGKCVHRGVELLVKGTLDWATVDELVAGYLRSCEQFLERTRFAVVGSETPCFDDAFACMPDLWGWLNNQATIVELKTGPVPKWAAIQTALQRRALMRDKGFAAVKRFGLQLRADGSLASLVPFENTRDEYTAMSMVESFDWKKDNGYIREWGNHGKRNSSD